MLRLLDLIWRIFKWSLWLTILRLLTTAFGWEFGVSRQYLRLLEWMLESGQERIAKVESEQRMNRLNELDSDEQLISQNEDESSAKRVHQIVAPPKTLDLSRTKIHSNGQTEAAKRQRKVSVFGAHFEATFRAGENGFTLVDGKLTPRNSSLVQDQQRRRRISTPDGPPVFLLDDDDDDDDEDEDEENNQSGHEQDSSPGADEEHCRQQLKTAAGQCQQPDDASFARREQHKREFHLEDPARLVVRGISAICDDQVTKRFTPEELKTWNLLTRTNAKNYQFMSRSLGFYWFCGLLIRYAVLMPLRIMFMLAGTVWLVCSMSLIGLLIPRGWRNKPFRLMSMMSFRMLSCGITSRLKFHNRQHRARPGDICVANHTSPIDVVLLACDNCYALVGQRHGGLLGLLEKALSRATNHVWFDRGEMRDRQLVTQRLKEHVSSKSNLPVLIFPEGTCINNSAVMMFRKGSFETNARICPAAIKYDSRFGDPFWNSSKQSYLEYLLMMMSSWAIKCDVWYLPPMERLPNESSAEFANRVKAEIAKQGGLEDLAWDGQLKRSSVKPLWLYQQQEDYVKRLKLE